MLLTPFARFVSCRLQRALRLAICEPDHVYRIDHIRSTSNRNYHSRRNRHLAVATIDNLRGLPLRVIWAYPHLGLRVYVCPKRHRLSRAHLADGAACATKKRVLVSKVPSNVAQVRTFRHLAQILEGIFTESCLCRLFFQYSWMDSDLSKWTFPSLVASFEYTRSDALSCAYDRRFFVTV